MAKKKRTRRRAKTKSRSNKSTTAKTQFFHVIGHRPGGGTRSAANKTAEEIVQSYVIPFVRNGTMKFQYGEVKEVQVVDLRIYVSDHKWSRKEHGTLDDFVSNLRNRYNTFYKRAEKILQQSGPRVFVVMPIQGKSGGSQEERRIFREFNSRFTAMERFFADEYGVTAIRIDKEYPLDEMVGVIKKEIDKAAFVVADLTDERPSCYFEAGYATAKGKPVLYIASEQSVLAPGQDTRIHFDIHNHVTFFADHDQLVNGLENKIEANRARLFPEDSSAAV